MSKVKMYSQKTIHISAWDGFKGLVAEADGVCEIAFVPVTNRASLTVNGEFKLSDITLTALKRHAERHYGVRESQWKRREQ